MQDKFEIGKIVNTFGIKGEVKIIPYTDDMGQFKKMEDIYVNNKVMKIENVRFHKNAVIIKLEGIDNMNDAENLRNATLEILRRKKNLPTNT